ncbi:MAG: 50S ribosomal protein L16 [Nanoarchaeota archaeon]|nr:50S ribosomal protein L16 [Nanoarchaeota archaeon]
MAKLRKFCAYRRLERPYTRTSRYRKKSFIRVRPHSKIVKYNMGDSKKKFDVTFDLISKGDLQIRHNAIESARLTCNRYLEKNLGKGGFYFEIRAFPHHILRENPLASGAGADRMSTGMKMSFGKPIGVAAQIRIGAPILSVSVNKNQMKVGREAVKKSSKKLPGKFSIVERAFSQTKAAVVKEKPVKEETPVEKKTEAVEEVPKKEVVEEKQEEAKPVEEAIEKEATPEVKIEEKSKAEVS